MGSMRWERIVVGYYYTAHLFINKYTETETRPIYRWCRDGKLIRTKRFFFDWKVLDEHVPDTGEIGSIHLPQLVIHGATVAVTPVSVGRS